MAGISSGVLDGADGLEVGHRDGAAILFVKPVHKGHTNFLDQVGLRFSHREDAIHEALFQLEDSPGWGAR